MYIYLKNVDIACISTGEVYGKIENNGCFWNSTRGYKNGSFGVGIVKTK